MRNKIRTPLNTIINRNKYERQNKFEMRANNEFRKSVKSLYVHDFSKCEENMVILKYPLFCMKGCFIYDYQHDLKKIKKNGVKSIFKELRIRFE